MNKKPSSNAMATMMRGAQKPGMAMNKTKKKHPHKPKK